MENILIVLSRGSRTMMLMRARLLSNANSSSTSNEWWVPANDRRVMNDRRVTNDPKRASELTGRRASSEEDCERETQRVSECDRERGGPSMLTRISKPFWICTPGTAAEAWSEGIGREERSERKVGARRATEIREKSVMSRTDGSAAGASTFSTLGRRAYV